MKKYYPVWTSIDSRKIPAWFKKAKFGIFVHWGVYSVPAWRGINSELFGSYAEWYYASVYGDYQNHDQDFHKKMYGEEFEYRDFVHSFKAELFNPDDWAALFKNAGAKYVVLTTKHHDGYCLWPTENQHKKNWKVTDVGPNRDLLGELAMAVRSNGLKMGCYYSIIDWETNRSHRCEGKHFIPEKIAAKYGIPEDLYAKEILLPQLKELVEKYQPSLIFSDGGEWDLDEDYVQIKEFLTWLYNESPVKEEVVVNDRFFKGMPGNHGDYYSTEYNDKLGFEDHAWEESRGIGKSYGYNRAENIDSYNSYESIIKVMIDIIAQGGNFLLNVGPTSDGLIPVIQQERLKEIGCWMRINGEAIYDADSARSIVSWQATKKDNSIYLFIYEIPKNNLLMFDLIKNLKIKGVSILGIEKNIEYTQDNKSITVEIPCEDIYQLLINNKIPFVTYVLKITI